MGWYYIYLRRSQTHGNLQEGSSCGEFAFIIIIDNIVELVLDLKLEGIYEPETLLGGNQKVSHF